MDYFDMNRLTQLIDFAMKNPYYYSLSQKMALQYKIQKIEELEQTRKLVHKINIRMTKLMQCSSLENLRNQIYRKNWVLGEYKLFKNILVLYSICHSIQISNMKNQDLSYLQEIFRLKDSSIIRYQVASIADQHTRNLTHWTHEENTLLTSIIQRNNDPNWKDVAIELYRLSEGRFFRQFAECREQWNSHLNPAITKSEWTREEDMKLLQLIEQYGTRWSVISKGMGGARNQHMVKNRYNSLVKKMKNKRLSHKKMPTASTWEEQLLQAFRKIHIAHGNLNRKAKLATSRSEPSQEVKQKEDESMTELSQSNKIDPSPPMAPPQEDEFSIEKYLTLDAPFF